MESTLPLTISAQYGLIDQNEFFDKRIASKDVRGYYLIKKGEFAYNKSTSVDAPLGAIKRLDKYKNGVLSTLYILFKIIDDTSTSSDYLVTYYSTDLWHKEIQSIAAEGARNHGLLNIAPDDFFETMISIPLNVFEQKKVGELFQILDHLITLHQSKFFGDILKTIASYTLYWEQRKLIDIAEIRRGLTYKPTEISEDGIRVLRSSNINEDTFVMGEDDVFVNRKAINIPFVQNGDILITSANGSLRLVGKHAIIREITDNSAVHGGFMLLATAKNPQFLNAVMGASWYIKFINLFVAGGNGAIGNLSKNDLDEQTILVPYENEQELIGGFFDNLDHLITLHQLEPFQLIFKAIAYRIIDYAKSKPPRRRKYTGLISFIKCYV